MPADVHSAAVGELSGRSDIEGSLRWSPYFQHMRPKSFGVTFFLALTGYALSGGGSTVGQTLVDLAALLLLYSVLLWGGTNAFNTSQDDDDGAINLLEDPPPVPPHLASFSLGLKALAIALAAALGGTILALTAMAVVLSVYYSWRRAWFTRGKDVPVLDMVINAGGCGLGSVLMGYAFSGGEWDFRVVLVGFAFSVALFGGMPTSQIFQLSAMAPGERNYTSLLGARRVLIMGAMLFGLHLVVLGALDVKSIMRLGLSSVAGILWLIWGALVVVAIGHSLWWSRSAEQDPYRRMMRQLAIMMASQVAWTASAWIATA